MKEKTKIVIMIIVIILIFLIVLIKNKNLKRSVDNEITENQIISDLKNKTGVTGKEDIYEVINESNNVQSLNVKEDIKFKVALAGMLKQSKPEFEEIDKIIKEKHLSKNGMYINTNSRKKFLTLITKFTESKYKINEEGYLEIINDSIENDNDKKIKNMINSNELFIIDFSDKCYTIDEVSGQIIDYPFELMDPYQVFQMYRQENQNIVFVTTNTKDKLEDEEIFNELMTL